MSRDVETVGNEVWYEQSSLLFHVPMIGWNMMIFLFDFNKDEIKGKNALQSIDKSYVEFYSTYNLKNFFIPCFS